MKHIYTSLVDLDIFITLHVSSEQWKTSVIHPQSAFQIDKPESKPQIPEKSQKDKGSSW